MFVMFDGHSQSMRLLHSDSGWVSKDEWDSGHSVKIGFLVSAYFVRSGNYQVSCAYMMFFLACFSRITCYTGSYWWNNL